jgi:hypothetical protein
MNKIQLQNFANSLDGENIKFHLQTTGGEWYEQKYTNVFDNIELNTSYGVCVDGSTIDFIFKVGKKYDNILKTFVTQYINKYKVKNTYILVDGKVTNPKKIDVINKLKNSNRVAKYFFYTTLYGIGYFCYFMNDKTQKETNFLLKNYLDSLKISFKNEFSEAGWVYRFVINKDVKIHNNLLNNFNI